MLVVLFMMGVFCSAADEGKGSFKKFNDSQQRKSMIIKFWFYTPVYEMIFLFGESLNFFNDPSCED